MVFTKERTPLLAASAVAFIHPHIVFMLDVFFFVGRGVKQSVTISLLYLSC